MLCFIPLRSIQFGYASGGWVKHIILSVKNLQKVNVSQPSIGCQDIHCDEIGKE
jgi:hypothetical protein